MIPSLPLSPLQAVLLSLACAIVILVVLAVRLTRLADRIAEATGLSRGFVGVLLLAMATSLPELVSSFSATLMMGAPGLTFGNVYGSNVANLAFLGLMDLLVAGSIFVCATREDARNALIGIVLTGMSLLAVAASVAGVGDSRFMHAVSLTIVLLYLVALKLGYQPGAAPDPAASTGRAPWAPFLICAAGVAGVSLWLTDSCAKLAHLSGLGQTFVGALVLALATSLPELVVSFEAVRIGSPSMAIGNLVGSNLFNVTILACCALAAPRGNLYAVPEASAAVPMALGGIVMMLIVAAASWSRSSSALFGRLSPVSVVLATGYVVSNAILYGR